MDCPSYSADDLDQQLVVAIHDFNNLLVRDTGPIVKSIFKS